MRSRQPPNRWHDIVDGGVYPELQKCRNVQRQESAPRICAVRDDGEFTERRLAALKEGGIASFRADADKPLIEFA